VPSEQNSRVGATFTLTRFLSSERRRRDRAVYESVAKPLLLVSALFAALAVRSIAAQPDGSERTQQNHFAAQRTQGRFCVALDIGHLPTAAGAMAADGRMEYEFNRRMVQLVAADLQQDDRISVVVVNPEGKRISLSGRAAAAMAAGADLLLSIHHDSVNDRYLKAERQAEGRVLYYCDRFRGYSVFYSRKNRAPADSFKFAETLGVAMRRQGLTPTLHHAEPIKGENRELVNPDLGIYRFDDLVVLKSAAMPAALLECGVIVNRSEEAELLTEERQHKMVAAVHEAVVAMADLVRRD
jgi:N-acetylmuramoyl-L-alanine amidase